MPSAKFIRKDGKLVNANVQKPATPTYDYEFVFDSLEVADMFHEAVIVFRASLRSSALSKKVHSRELHDLADRMHCKINSAGRSGTITFSDRALRVLVSRMWGYVSGQDMMLHNDLEELADGYC